MTGMELSLLITPIGGLAYWIGTRPEKGEKRHRIIRHTVE